MSVTRKRKAVILTFDTILWNAAKKHIGTIVPKTNFSQYIEMILVKDAIQKDWLPENFKLSPEQREALGKDNGQQIPISG